MKIDSYILPDSLQEGLKILDSEDKIKVIAGGTDLVVKIKNGYYSELEGLISFHNFNLDQIVIKDDKVLIGSYCSMYSIAANQIIREYFPALAIAASQVGSLQIQNLATIGGNIANASPAGDTIPPLYTLDAELELISVNSSRVVKICDFFVEPGKTIMNKNELIKNIILPLRKTEGGFIKVGERKAHAISKVSVAFSKEKEVDKTSNTKKVVFAFGAVAPTVVKLELTEDFFKTLNKENFLGQLDSYYSVIENIIKPIDDIRSTKFYRTKLAKELFKKAIIAITKLDV